MTNNTQPTAATHSSKRKPEGVYATHEKESLLFVKAKVNGQLSAAYVKNGKLVSYEPLTDLLEQIYNGPCLEFTTT